MSTIRGTKWITSSTVRHHMLSNKCICACIKLQNSKGVHAYYTITTSTLTLSNTSSKWTGSNSHIVRSVTTTVFTQIRTLQPPLHHIHHTLQHHGRRNTRQTHYHTTKNDRTGMLRPSHPSDTNETHPGGRSGRGRRQRTVRRDGTIVPAEPQP